MSEAIRTGVVGVGHLGRHHARIYGELPESNLVGIVDQDRERAAAKADELGCRVFDSVEALAAEVDAVSVAVPTEGHAAVACDLLARGVDVLVEKPIAKSIEEAEAINRAAEANDRIVMVGHTERFNPAVRAFAERVQEPRFFEVHRLAAFTARSTDVDVVLDLMIHDLDLLLAFEKSEPTSVDAAGVAALTNKVDIANARIRFASGCVANLTASRISAEPIRRIRLFQDRTYLACDTGQRRVEHYQVQLGADGAPAIQREEVAVDEAEPLSLELSTFLDAVRTRTAPKIDGRQGQRALELAHRVLRSIEAGEPSLA